jgi:hypothetical protein
VVQNDAGRHRRPRHPAQHRRVSYATERAGGRRKEGKGGFVYAGGWACRLNDGFSGSLEGPLQETSEPGAARPPSSPRLTPFELSESAGISRHSKAGGPGDERGATRRGLVIARARGRAVRPGSPCSRLEPTRAGPAASWGASQWERAAVRRRGEGSLTRPA